MFPGQRDLGAVEIWLWDLISAAPPGPPILLGSPEWAAADDASRLASLAGAALVTLHEADPAVIAARLAAELLVHNLAMAAAAKAVHAADPAVWSALANRRNQLGMSLPEYRAAHAFGESA